MITDMNGHAQASLESMKAKEEDGRAILLPKGDET